MDEIKKILAPTDFSDLSKVGIGYALEVARDAGAEVIVYHVIDLGDQWSVRPADFGSVHELLERHKRMLDKFLRANFPDDLNLTEVRQVVELGAVAHNIVEIAERERVDRIVMSSHGRTGFNRLMMGSVSEKVIARAPCPVRVIPARAIWYGRRHKALQSLEQKTSPYGV